MNIQECPRLGRHCITLRAVLNHPQNLSISAKTMISKTPLDLPPTLVEITPISSVVDLLESAEKTLSSMHGHPTDLTMIGIETSGLLQLQLLVARKEEKQKRLDSEDVAGAAEQEAKIAREMSHRIKPLADSIQLNRANAEDTMKVLLEEQNPAQARKLLLAHMRSPATVMQDFEVLNAGAEEPSGSACLVKGKKSHRLRVDILSTDREKSGCTARLIKLESPCDLFKPSDVGIQVVSLSAYDQDTFFVLCQCAALGMPLSVNLSIDVSMTSKCFQYRAVLLSIPDKPSLLQQLRERMLSRTMDMFAT